jgi:cell division protein FtsL
LPEIFHDSDPPGFMGGIEYMIEGSRMGTGSSRRSGKLVVSQRPSILQWAGVYRPPTLGLFLLLSIALISGLSVVNTTHENRFSFNELQELREQANALEIEWGQLLIEQSTFSVEGRIEQKAVNRLQMRVPETSNIVMVSHE